MRTISPFENRQLCCYKEARVRIHMTTRLSTVAALFLSLVGAAQPLSDDKNPPSTFPYKSYGETEIAEALQRPLRLEDCIGIALRKNLSLRQSEGDVRRAEASHSGSYGKFLPVFSLTGSRENSSLQAKDFTDTLETQLIWVDRRFDNQSALSGRMNLYTPIGASFQVTSDFFRAASSPVGDDLVNSGNRGYSVKFTQPLLRGAGTTVARSDVISTGYDREVQERNLYIEKLQTVLAVRRAYYDAISKRELVKVNQAAVNSDSILVQSSQALILAKLASRRDVLSAEIRFADDRAALIKSQNEFELSLDALKEILGIPIELPIVLDEGGLEYAPVTLDENALIGMALEISPSIQNAQTGIKRSRLERSLTKNTLLPQLDVAVSYSSDLELDPFKREDDLRTAGWQASVSLNYAFLNREAAASAENAEIAVRQQEDRLLELQRRLVVNIRDIVRSVYTASEEISAIKRGIELAQSKFDFATAMFNLGRASNIDITDAQEFLLKSQTQYLRKLVEYNTQLALLESLTGQPVTP